MKRIALDNPRYYLNRHVQWLEFNRRVLEEARDIGNPLLERVKFLAITANNLDEFVEVRVSSFLQHIEHGSRETSPDGLTAEEELAKVSDAMHVFVRDQYKCWNEEIASGAGQRIDPRSGGRRTDAKAAKARKKFYDRRVNPMLTPVTVDPSHPFPHVLNKALCIAFLLRRRRGGNGKPYFGVVTVPRALPPFAAGSGGKQRHSLRLSPGHYFHIRVEALSRLRDSGFGCISHHAEQQSVPGRRRNAQPAGGHRLASRAAAQRRCGTARN